jgi:hypothetical protein
MNMYTPTGIKFNKEFLRALLLIYFCACCMLMACFQLLTHSLHLFYSLVMLV